jgi:hypothetical protein
MFAERVGRLRDFIDAIPPEYLDRVIIVLSEWPVSAEHGKRHALVRFADVMMWPDHPLNRNRPYPLPSALLDLLLDHPDANLSCGHCRGCGIPTPYTLPQGEPGVNFVRPKPYTNTCPACGFSESDRVVNVESTP